MVPALTPGQASRHSMDKPNNSPQNQSRSEMGDQGLTQDDFRKLLSTPRAERLGGQTPRMGSAGTNIASSSGNKEAKSAKPHKPKPKPKPKEGEDEEDDGPIYR